MTKERDKLVKKHEDRIHEQLIEDLAQMEDYSEECITSGYFLLSVNKGVDDYTRSSVIFYDSIDYISLLGFLEYYVSVIKRQINEAISDNVVVEKIDKSVAESIADDLKDNQSALNDDQPLIPKKKSAIDIDVSKLINSIVQRKDNPPS